MPLIGAGCKGCWCVPVQARVWAFGVVVDPPCFDDPARRDQAAEQVLVEAFIPEPAVNTSGGSTIAPDEYWGQITSYTAGDIVIACTDTSNGCPGSGAVTIDYSGVSGAQSVTVSANESLSDIQPGDYVECHGPSVGTNLYDGHSVVFGVPPAVVGHFL